MAHPRAYGGSWREKVRVFRGNGCAGLAQGAHVVQHPERASVRCDNQIVVVNDQIVDRSRREIKLQRLPV